MRVTVGTIAVLGLAVAAAVAQPPAPRERAATLLPPQALAPGDSPPVARGSSDDFPPSTSISSTPVAKPATPTWRVSPSSAPNVPTWSTGTDQPVVPVTSLASNSARSLPSATPDDPSLQLRPQPKFLDRVKGTFGSDNKAAGAKQPVQNQNAAPPEQPTAATPFRATGANGAPVYAGPPAYRWYGWGTVTPGANPLAPAGQYPKASANWYAITGATPGAFPVPVGNAVRTVVGTEPPSYGLAARTPPAPQPVPPPTQQQLAQQQPAPHATERPDPPRFAPGTGPKFMPGSDSAGAAHPPVFNPPPAPVGVPTLTPPPVTKPVASAPVLTPTLPPPPSSVVAVKEPGPANLPPLPELPKATKEPEPVPPAPNPKPDQAAVSPPAILPPLPIPPIAAAPLVEPVRVPVPVIETNPVVETRPANVPLPTSATNNPPREELRWQQSTEPATPAPGTWAPAPGATPLPTVPAGTAPGTPAPVARGQMGDQQPDPITTLIKQICQGRAEGVEVRWTGTKKLSVCFEVHTRAEAQKLVNDISRRPELVSYQIDFCALVR